MDVAYLAACAVNGEAPDVQRVAGMDLNALYQAAERHLLTGITAMTLERAGVQDAAFTQAKGKAIRKVVIFDVERANILARLEEAGIWYAPLKGCVLKDLYPQIGMRQMADNDILYDASRTQEVRSIMEALGFSTDSAFGRGVHDHYLKPPVCNFEMHRSLFGAGHNECLIEYYQDVKNRLIPNEGSRCGYHFSDEDFYVYSIAHEYKHYSGGGTGLRSLLDTYVYLKKKSDAMDWRYIAKELEKLNLEDFEERNRSLALRLFSGGALTEQEQDMLDYVISSGTYGTLQNRVKNNIAAYGGGWAKLRYMRDRFLVPITRSNKRYDTYAAAYPFFYRHKLLLPLLPLYRLCSRWSSVKAELRALRKNR